MMVSFRGSCDFHLGRSASPNPSQAQTKMHATIVVKKSTLTGGFMVFGHHSLRVCVRYLGESASAVKQQVV